MQNVTKLTPNILKKIIKEEKLKLKKEKSINENKPKTKKEKIVNDIRQIKILERKQQKLAIKLKKVFEARQILKKRLMGKL